MKLSKKAKLLTLFCVCLIVFSGFGVNAVIKDKNFFEDFSISRSVNEIKSVFGIDVSEESSYPEISTKYVEAEKISVFSGETGESLSIYYEDIKNMMEYKGVKAAQVNDVIIYKSDILDFKATQDKAARDYMNTFSDEKERQSAYEQYSLSYEEILEMFIRNEIAYSIAEKQGIKVDEEAIIQGVNETISYAKNDKENGEQFIKNLQAHNYSEEDYFDHLLDSAKKRSLYYQLYKSVYPGGELLNDEQKEFDAYLDSFRDKYEIQKF